MAPIKVPFSYELATQPVEQDLTNVAAGCGALTVRLDGLETGDTVQQAVFTADATGAGASVVKEISPTANDDGQITAASLNSRQRVLAFTFTAADIATIAAGDYTYAVRVWVLRDSETRDREVLVGAIEARAAVVTTEGVSAVATVTVTPATASGNVGATDQLTAVAKDVDGNTLVGITFTWTSSDTNVATVDASGLVTYVTPGIATITAKAHGAKDTCEVTSNSAGFTAAAEGDYPVYAAGLWTTQNPEGRFYPQATVDAKDAAVAAAAAADATSKANAAQAAAISYADTGFAALDASALTSGFVPDDRIAETNVTQHQGALAIGIGQLTGFGAGGGYLRSDGAAWTRVAGLAAADLTGTIASPRLAGAYTGITGVGTLTALAVSGIAQLQATTVTSLTMSGALTGATTGDFAGNVTIGGRQIITGNADGGLAVGGDAYNHVLVAIGLNNHPLQETHQVGVYSALKANSFADGAGSFNAGFESAIGTQDGVFTLEAAASYTVGSLTKGVGSTITRSWGLATYEESAATHNATIAPLDATFTGNWFIYYPHTRPSYLGGDLTVIGALKVAGGEVYNGAADTFLRLAGGASAGDGASIILSGPSHPTVPGRLYLTATGTGAVVLRAGAIEHLTLASDGTITAGPGTVLAAQAITGTTYSGTGTASFGGTVTFAGHEACSGSTSGFVRLAGGTTADGATVLMFGSTHATAPGRLNLTATGTGSIILRAGITDRMTLASDGTITLGVGTVFAAQAFTATTVAASGAFGCNGATAQTKATLGAAATDLASVITLANNMRTALINNGIGQT